MDASYVVSQGYKSCETEITEKLETAYRQVQENCRISSFRPYLKWTVII